MRTLGCVHIVNQSEECLLWLLKRWQLRCSYMICSISAYEDKMDRITETDIGKVAQQNVSYLCISSVQSLSHVRLFATPWTAACQASLSVIDSRDLFKFMSIKSVMLSNHLILCHPLLLPPSIFPSIRVFLSESVL